jgi:hypothetical protein
MNAINRPTGDCWLFARKDRIAPSPADGEAAQGGALAALLLLNTAKNRRAVVADMVDTITGCAYRHALLLFPIWIISYPI